MKQSIWDPITGLFPVSPTDTTVYDFSYILRYAHAMFFNFGTNFAAADLTTNLIKHTSVLAHLCLGILHLPDTISLKFFSVNFQLKLKHRTWVFYIKNIVIIMKSLSSYNSCVHLRRKTFLPSPPALLFVIPPEIRAVRCLSSLGG